MCTRKWDVNNRRGNRQCIHAKHVQLYLRENPYLLFNTVTCTGKVLPTVVGTVVSAEYVVASEGKCVSLKVAT